MRVASMTIFSGIAYSAAPGMVPYHGTTPVARIR
jgi:hypothetical protein